MAILKKIRSGVDKVRKKYIPTFGEQFDKAKKEGKKTFKSTRDDKKKGKLEYSTMRKKEVSDKIAAGRRDDAKVQPNAPKKKGTYEKATGTKISSRGQAFAKARKEGKDSFTFNGKSYSTRLKGEKRPATPEIKNQSAKKSSDKRILANTGGRANLRGGGMSQRGLGKAFKNGGRL